MDKNRREHNRDELIAEPNTALFFIEVENTRYPLHKVHDLSVSGVGIEAPIAISKSTEIGLCFEEADYRINVIGTVMWCLPGTNDTFRLGIKFSPRTAQNNLLLFMAMRRYIDEFGEQD